MKSVDSVINFFRWIRAEYIIRKHQALSEYVESKHAKGLMCASEEKYLISNKVCNAGVDRFIYRPRFL